MPGLARVLRISAVVLAAAIPFVASPNTAFRVQLMMLYAVAALAMYICMEVAGEFMVGHLLIVAAGAYVTAWTNIEMGVPPTLTLPIAVLSGAAMALLLGLPGIRLSGFYLALFSFFAVLIIPDLAKITRPLTGGEFGLSGIEGLSLFGVDMGSRGLYLTVLVILVLAYLFTRNLIRTAWGTRFMAMRDAPQALQAAGLDLRVTKGMAYLASSLPASVAGWLLAFVNGVVFPGLFSLGLLIVLLAAVVAAGKNMAGAVVAGALLFSGWGEFVGPFSEWNPLGLGVVLILVVIAAPSGVGALRPPAGRARSDTSTQERSNATDAEAVLVEREMTLPDPVLRLTGIRKAFGGNTALGGVDAAFGPGRIVGLVGANGSGKTTLVNVITGFLSPDEGEVEVAGIAVVGSSPHQIARMGVTRTFQLPQLVDDISVRRNIDVGLLRQYPDPLAAFVLGGRSARGPVRDRRMATDRIATLLRLDVEVLDRPAGELSLGLKRIVEIGRALATGAGVLCLDEPAAGLNEDEIEALGATLRDVAASGRTVVLIEHHMSFVLELCDDVLVLDHGQVSAWVPDLQQVTALPEALQTHVGLGVG